MNKVKYSVTFKIDIEASFGKDIEIKRNETEMNTVVEAMIKSCFVNYTDDDVKVNIIESEYKIEEE